MSAIDDRRAVGSRWRRFWERGGWWRAVLLAAAYFALFQLTSIGLGTTLEENAGEPGTAQNVLMTVAVPIAIGSVILVVFALSVGWLRALFGP